MRPDRAVDRPKKSASEEAAYDAVMCWEWEGGALAPTAVDHARRPRPRDERQRARSPDHSHRRRLGGVAE
jgi:hypothetical protein